MSNYIESLVSRGSPEDIETLAKFAEFGYAFSKLPLDGRTFEILQTRTEVIVLVEGLNGVLPAVASGENVIEAIERVVPQISHAYGDDKGYEFFRKRIQKQQGGDLA